MGKSGIERRENSGVPESEFLLFLPRVLSEWGWDDGRGWSREGE